MERLRRGRAVAMCGNCSVRQKSNQCARIAERLNPYRPKRAYLAGARPVLAAMQPLEDYGGRADCRKPSARGRLYEFTSLVDAKRTGSDLERRHLAMSRDWLPGRDQRAAHGAR